MSLDIWEALTSIIREIFIFLNARLLYHCVVDEVEEDGVGVHEGDEVEEVVEVDRDAGEDRGRGQGQEGWGMLMSLTWVAPGVIWKVIRLQDGSRWVIPGSTWPRDGLGLIRVDLSFGIYASHGGPFGLRSNFSSLASPKLHPRSVSRFRKLKCAKDFNGDENKKM